MGRLTIATKFNTARLLQFVFPAVAMMMNFLPQPISTFMVNSDFRGIILWAVLFVLTYLIYLPFFKVYEKQELESEQEVNTLRKEETNG